MYSAMAAAMRRLAARLADDVVHAGSGDAEQIRDLINRPLREISRASTDGDGRGADEVHRAAETTTPAGLSVPATTRREPRFFATPAAAQAYGTRTWGATVRGLTSSQRGLLTNYTSGYSTTINDLLREGFPLWPTLREKVDELDAIVRLQPTHEWIRVHKTIQSRRLLPDVDIADVTPGYRGRFRDFVSTSMHRDGISGLQWLEGRDVDATIDVAPGTPAVYVGDVSDNPAEFELLLGRDLDFDLADRQRVGDRWTANISILPQ